MIRNVVSFGTYTLSASIPLYSLESTPVTRLEPLVMYRDFPYLPYSLLELFRVY